MKRGVWMSLCTFALAACSHSGNDFVGNWVNANSAMKDTLAITPNGDGFLVTEKQPGYPTKTSSAKMSGDALAASVDGMPVTYAINEKNGHLVDGEGDYIRIGK